MLVIFGLFVLVVAVTVGVVGVLANSGVAHPLPESFSVFGGHITGSTGTVFLFGIVIGAVAMLGLSVLLVGARRTASRGQVARRELVRSQRETEFVNRDLDSLRHDRQPEVPARATVSSAEVVSHRNSRWPWAKEPTGRH
jgi:hypothetical protein